MMNGEIIMNKLAEEFMGKFELGDMSVEEFFCDDVDTINEAVTKKGWYRYENCMGLVDIEFVGENIDEEFMEELRYSEKMFLGDGSEDFKYELKEDFIDIEEVCYVKVG
jgi:hypothetical protein